MHLMRSLSLSLCALSVAAIARAQSTLRVHDVDSLSWMPAAVPGLELAVVDGNPQGPGPYTVAMRYKAGITTPLHTHPADMSLVVIRGQFFVGAGSGDKPLGAGSVVLIPKGVKHAEGAITDAVVLLSGQGPMTIEMVGGPPGH